MLRYFILLLPCFVSIFWGITFLFRWKKSYRAQRALMVSLFFAAVSFYIFARSYAFDGDYLLRCKEDVIHTFTALMVYPLYMYYFRFLCDDRKLRWWEFLFFLPALLVSITTIVCYGIMGEDGAVRYAREMLYNYTDSPKPDDLVFRVQYFVGVKLFDWLLFLQAIVTAVYALVNLKRWRLKLMDFYSDLEDKSIRNSYIILICLMVYLLVIFVCTQISRSQYFLSFSWTAIIFIAFAVCTYVQAYAGFQLKFATEDMTKLLREIDDDTESIQSVVSDECDECVKARNTNLVTTGRGKFPAGLESEFRNLMEKENMYLQNDLRLDDVVRRMHTNRTYISRLINEMYSCSFSDLINNYRVDHAKKLMLCIKNLSLEGVALQSGFVHLSSFSRTFKRVTGQTPGAWQKMQKNTMSDISI